MSLFIAFRTPFSLDGMTTDFTLLIPVVLLVLLLINITKESKVKSSETNFTDQSFISHAKSWSCHVLSFILSLHPVSFHFIYLSIQFISFHSAWLVPCTTHFTSWSCLTTNPFWLMLVMLSKQFRTPIMQMHGPLHLLWNTLLWLCWSPTTAVIMGSSSVQISTQECYFRFMWFHALCNYTSILLRLYVASLVSMMFLRGANYLFLLEIAFYGIWYFNKLSTPKEGSITVTRWLLQVGWVIDWLVRSS